jgi:outer membrane protein OmpA-like peptidoglycan-associated protein
MRAFSLRNLLVVGIACAVVFLVGCAGMEYVPGGHYFYYHQELPAAKRAIEAARQAGKDKQCPAEFQAAEKLMKDAYATYYACHTQEAIAMAKEAIAKANALCPVVEAPKPAPAPAAAAPTISFSAAPASVVSGSCANLTWYTTNATSVSIDEGVGGVDASGSKQVCPTSTTRYTLTATGEGGSRTDSTTVTVTAPAEPIDRFTIHVNFDTDKSTIRKADLDELNKAADFVRKYPGCKIEVDGYTDSTGTEQYNMGLSDRRAESVKKWLLDNGATAADKITSRGFGEANPIADNGTAKGRFQNRRVEILIISR